MASDAQTCPLCGGPNDCGMAAGAASCWCFSAAVPADVLDRVPEEARGTVCVCRACAEGRGVSADSASADAADAASAAPGGAPSAPSSPNAPPRTQDH